MWLLFRKLHVSPLLLLLDKLDRCPSVEIFVFSFAVHCVVIGWKPSWTGDLNEENITAASNLSLA